MPKICVAAFYHFAKLDNLAEYKNLLLDKCNSLDLLGTILLANEGINGTISGSASAISDILGFIRSDERLKNLVHKESYSDEPPFLRMKVKLKSEKKIEMDNWTLTNTLLLLLALTQLTNGFVLKDTIKGQLNEEVSKETLKTDQR